MSDYGCECLCPACCVSGGRSHYCVIQQAEAMFHIRMPEPKVDKKPTNPKDAVGIAKVPASCVPLGVLGELGLAMMEGALKYGRHNYRLAGVRASVYYDAGRRHMDAYWEGEDIDPDSGLPHLVKAMACFTVMRDSQMMGNFVDDRPPPLPKDWIAKLNALAKSLLEKYPDPKPAALASDHKGMNV